MQFQGPTSNDTKRFLSTFVPHGAFGGSALRVELHEALFDECIDLFASGSAVKSDLVGDVELGIGDTNEEHAGG